MTVDQQRILIQLARRGLAVMSEAIDPGQGIAAWQAIAALQQDFADRVKAAQSEKIDK